MKTILIIDDDPALVDFLRVLLESEGYEILETNDGASGLELLDKNSPHLILLDFMMPNMTGLEVLRVIKQKFPAIPIVMLTGKGSEEIAVECMKAGAIDYLVKPFESNRLLNVVHSVLR